tara:strand:+ start:10917 stop:12236 length:1320 start_codon:yes stop_codon:yes gene_type:complete
MSAQSTEITLTENQEDGLAAMLSFLVDTEKQILVLKGDSGAGKTTLINEFIVRLPDYIKYMKSAVPELTLPFVHLTATTHKAAQVIEEKTGIQAVTIHSLLSLRIQQNYRSGKEELVPYEDATVVSSRLRGSLIIIDEASMISGMLLSWVMKCLNKDFKIIMVGDPSQVVSVGESTSKAFNSSFPSFHLTGTQRQKEGNSILQFADQIRETIKTGVFSPIQFDNQNLIHLSGEDFQSVIDSKFKDKDFSKDNKIIAWRNARVNAYNQYVRKLYTSEDIPQPGEIYISNSAVVASNNLITLQNNAEVVIKSANQDYFGDDNFPVYRIKTTNPKSPDFFMPRNSDAYHAFLKSLAKEAKADKNWFRYFSYKNQIADLRPGAAVTVHKSQGSTFREVFIDLGDIGKCNNADTVARMLYVAVTRAYFRVYFTGDLPPKYKGES